MKKILLIGQLTDISGYGNASRDYLKTLSLIDNLELKCLNFSFEKNEFSNELVNKFSITRDLSKKAGKYSKEEIDVILNYCNEDCDIIFFLTNDWLSFGSNTVEKSLNEMINLNLICKRSKRVFPCVVWETDTVPKIWHNGYNSLSNIKSLICACDWNKEIFESQTRFSGTVIPYVPLVTNEYDAKYYNRLKSLSEGKFSFCSVAQWNDRKGMEEMIRSFFLEFKDDDVLLFLKTYTNEAMTGISRRDFLIQKIKNIKASINHYGSQNNFKCKIILIDNFLSKEEINAIFKVSDCYLTCTKGEGFGLPIAEFLMFNDKPVVCPSLGGHLNLCSDSNFFIDSIYEPAIVSGNHHYSEIEMNYVQVSINSTRKKMREVYSSELREGYSNKCLKHLNRERNIKLFKETLGVM